MKKIYFLIIILFISCSERDEKCFCNSKLMNEWCLRGVKWFERDYYDKKKIVVWVESIPNVEYEKYRYTLRTYGKELDVNRFADGFDDYDNLVIKQDTFGIGIYCYKQLVDPIIFKKFGDNFYEEVEKRVKNDFKGMTEEEITEMYYRDYPIEDK